MQGEPDDGPRLVDWAGMGRRLRRSAAVLASLAATGWLVTGLAGMGLHVGGLAAWFGGAVLAMFAVEVVIVGGSAVRGLLRAGERGERLAGGDVGLLPPQVTRGSGDGP